MTVNPSGLKIVWRPPIPHIPTPYPMGVPLPPPVSPLNIGFLGKYEGKFTGSESLCSSISFFGNKTITSGEGGAFVTSDEEIFEFINTTKNQGQSDSKFIHNVLGYNYRMTNVQAALLYGQLCDLNEIQQRKSYVFEEYTKNLESVDNICFQKIEPGTDHSKWMFGVRFTDFTITEKKLLELYLFESGIDVRPMFYDIKKHDYLKEIDAVTKNAQQLQEQCLIFPSYPELTKSQIKYITNKIKKFLKKL